MKCLARAMAFDHSVKKSKYWAGPRSGSCCLYPVHLIRFPFAKRYFQPLHVRRLSEYPWPVCVYIDTYRQHYTATVSASQCLPLPKKTTMWTTKENNNKKRVNIYGHIDDHIAIKQVVLWRRHRLRSSSPNHPSDRMVCCVIHGPAELQRCMDFGLEPPVTSSNRIVSKPAAGTKPSPSRCPINDQFFSTLIWVLYRTLFLLYDFVSCSTVWKTGWDFHL